LALIALGLIAVGWLWLRSIDRDMERGRLNDVEWKVIHLRNRVEALERNR
jgi:hypothetical protein